MRNRFALAVAIFFIVVVSAGCQRDSEGSKEALKMNENLRAHCVGRFTIRLPESFKPVMRDSDGPGDVTFYYGRDNAFKTVDVTVAKHSVGQDEFRRAVATRESSIAAQVNYESNTPMLVDRKDVSPVVVNLKYYASVDISDAYKLEEHVLVEDAHVILRTSGDDSSAQERLDRLAASIRRIKDDARIGAGFCVAGIVIGTDNDFEEAHLTYADSARGHRDVRLSFDFNNFKQSSDEGSLIERGEFNLVGLGANPKIIKKGQVQLAGEQGEQWLGRFDEEGHRQHGFYAETAQRDPSRERPKVHIEFSTGGQKLDGKYIDASLDDKDAEKLWTSIIESLRRRTETSV